MRALVVPLSLLVASACLTDAGAYAPAHAALSPPRPALHRTAHAEPFAVDALALEPRDARVEAHQPIEVRFDHAVERASVERAFGVDPPVPGRIAWRDDRTFRFVPTRWEPGHDYRVRIGGVAPHGGTVIGTSWSFRTRVPEPAKIVPGHGTNVVLTFDDGAQSPHQAVELLALLERLGIRALFFPSGRWAKAHPHFVKRAIADGHRVCNHTFSHVNLSLPFMTDARIRSEIARGANDGGCHLFRPPLMGYDTRVTRIARELGYELFLWDVDSRDWEGGPAVDIENLVLGKVRPGAVVLFHMHASATLEILPDLATRLRKAGYVLSWDPADARPDTGPVNIAQPLAVQGRWLSAASTSVGRERAALLDLAELGPGKIDTDEP